MKDNWRQKERQLPHRKHVAKNHKSKCPPEQSFRRRRKLPLKVQRLENPSGSPLVPRDDFMKDNWRQKERQLPHRKHVAKNHKSKCPPEQSFRRRRKLPLEYKE